MNTKRSLMMTVALAATILAFGLTFKAAAGDAKSVTTQLSVPLDETVYSPAKGETVHFVGEVPFMVHTKTLADGNVIVSIQNHGFIPGIGDKTGDSYHLMTHDKFNFAFKATGFPFTVTIQCCTTIPNPGSCNDVCVPLTVRFTIQKDGSATAKYVEDDGGDATP